jgi:hypothetical protein
MQAPVHHQYRPRLHRQVRLGAPASLMSWPVEISNVTSATVIFFATWREAHVASPKNQTFCDGDHIRDVTLITAAVWSVSDNR